MNMNWLKKNWIMVVLMLGVAYYFFVYKKQNIKKVDDIVDDNPVIGGGGGYSPVNVVDDNPVIGGGGGYSPVNNEDQPTISVGAESTIKPTPFVITDIPTLQLIKESLNKQPTVTAFSRSDKVSLFGGKKWKN